MILSTEFLSNVGFVLAMKTVIMIIHISIENTFSDVADL